MPNRSTWRIGLRQALRLAGGRVAEQERVCSRAPLRGRRSRSRGRISARAPERGFVHSRREIGSPALGDLEAALRRNAAAVRRTGHLPADLRLRAVRDRSPCSSVCKFIVALRPRCAHASSTSVSAIPSSTPNREQVAAEIGPQAVAQHQDFPSSASRAQRSLRRGEEHASSSAKADGSPPAGSPPAAGWCRPEAIGIRPADPALDGCAVRVSSAAVHSIVAIPRRRS